MAMPNAWCKSTLVCSTGDRDHFYNVFYYRCPTWVSSGSFDGMAYCLTLSAAIFTQLNAHLHPLCGADVRVRGVNTQLHADGQVYDLSRVDLQSTGSGDVHPDYVAVCIQKRTDHPGRSGRGRWFWGPVLEENTLEDYLLDISIPYYNAVAADWMADVTSGGDLWEACLHSKKDNTLYPITSVYVDPKLASLGGRKRTVLL